MRKTIAASLFATAVLVSATNSGAQTAGATHDHATMSPPSSGTSTALLTSPLGSRAASGSAILTGTTLQLTWTGDKPGAVRSWSLRQGSCARDNGIVNRPAAYAPLTVDAGGSATSTATLVAAPDSSDALFVVVYATKADSLPEVLACGALSNGVPRMRAVAAVDHSSMDHSAMNMAGGALAADSTAGMAGMDHAAMGHAMNAAASGDTATTTLLAIHERMMADPVIRERVRSDPVLQRMLKELPTEGMTPAPSAKPAASNTAAKSNSGAQAKAPTKTNAKPPTTTKPPANTMPGMDHSKMPGMKKPPA